MAKECVYDDALTVQFPGERVFLKTGAAQSVLYILQQLRGTRGVNQLGNYSSRPQATNVKAALCARYWFTHPWFDQ